MAKEYGPGKFEGVYYWRIAQHLYDTSDGGNGSVGDLGWWDSFSGKIKGRQVNAIITEDSQGFVSMETYDTPEELSAVIESLEDEDSEFYAQQEQEC